MNMEKFNSLWDYLDTIPEPKTAEEIALCSYSDAIDDIGIALSEYRIENGMTQTELAQKLGFSQSVLSGYENGSRNMSIRVACDILAKIGKKLNIKIEEAVQQVNTQESIFFDDTLSYAKEEMSWDNISCTEDNGQEVVAA